MLTSARPLQNDAQAVQQAQGAALSVTQTALAVVGGIIGSSVLTGVAFVLVLRHRRKKRRQGSARGDGVSGGDNKDKDAEGFPQATGGLPAPAQKSYAGSDDGSSTYSTDDNGFPFPVGDNNNNGGSNLARPAPAATSSSSAAADGIPRKTFSSKIGYAISYYGPRAAATGPRGAAGAGAGAGAGTTASSSSGALGGTNPRGNGRSSIITTTTTTTSKSPFRFQLGNPPPPKWGSSAATGGGGGGGASTATATAARASSSPSTTAAESSLSTAPGGRFTLFPSKRRVADPTPSSSSGDQPGSQAEVGPSQQATSAAWPSSSAAAAAAAAGGSVSVSGAGRFGNTATATAASAAARGGGDRDRGRSSGQARGSAGGGSPPLVPSLDRWLRDGTDVSPFSTLNKIG